MYSGSRIHRKKARLLNPARAHEDGARPGGRGARSRARGPAPVASTRTVSPYIKPFIWLLRFNGAHLRSAGDARTGERADSPTYHDVRTRLEAHSDALS